MKYGYSYIYYGDDPKHNLDTLRHARDEDFDYLYIKHTGEDGDKDHYHIYILTQEKKNRITDHLYETLGKKLNHTIVNPINNLGTMFAYAYHDKKFLDRAHEKRQYYYSPEDIVSSNDDLMGRLTAEMNHELYQMDWLVEAVKNNYNQGMTKYQCLIATYNGLTTYLATKAFVYDYYDERAKGNETGISEGETSEESERDNTIVLTSNKNMERNNERPAGFIPVFAVDGDGQIIQQSYSPSQYIPSNESDERPIVRFAGKNENRNA